jgi:2-polyprenyl-6-hydroxyphenyl methylase/3-demethylubiquinone-9 3-methyltransferase
MTPYYASFLSGQRLKKCYDIAPPRIQGYLRAELDFVLDRISAEGWTLDLGCGYGRIIPDLLKKARGVVGIDNSLPNLAFAGPYLKGFDRFSLLAMDAGRLGFGPGVFSNVVCIQNGISAFKVEPSQLLKEAVRVTRPDGRILFSTYADAFWEDRLDWFRLQARQGLVGEIDEDKTQRGTIACRDSFRATTFSPDNFRDLARELDVEVEIAEVDGSSLFCLVHPRQPRSFSH